MMFREASRFGVRFAGDRDVCFYCLKELWLAHKGETVEQFNSVLGKRQLEGQLTGEKVWAQGDVILCKRHSQLICAELGNDMPEEELEEAADE